MTGRVTKARWVVAALFAALGATSCGEGTGTVTVSLWGEDYIRDVIPAATTTTAGFENGWSLRYTKFLVNLGEVRLTTSTGRVAGTLANFRVYDLHALTGPTTIGTFANVDAVRYDAASFSLAPVEIGAAGNATAADVQLMQVGRYAIYVDATASKMGAADVRIRWGFRGRTDFSPCSDAAGQAGLAVPTGGTASFQVTVHGDHLFYDDLENPDARMRFDAIAGADADGDHEVTLDELSRVALTSLPMTQYSAGPVPNVRNLRDFVTYLFATVGHFNGEGHCQERRS